MRIAMIGSGNVATHLSAALVNAGHQITQVWSRNYQNAALLAYHVKAEAIHDPEEFSGHPDLVIISVNDDAIASVLFRLKLESSIVVHTSGSTPMVILEGASAKTGVLYPLQTFSKTKSVDFLTVPLLIEGNSPEVLSQLTALAQTISNNVQEVSSEKRLSLHVAAVFACNFSNYLYAVAKEILDGQQLDFKLIEPLIRETADKVRDADPKEVQTGPAIRNDVLTINRHLDYLENAPELKELYADLSQRMINFYRKAQR